MKTALLAGMLAVMPVLSLQACSSPPKPPEPTGQWVPVNPSAAQSRAEPK